MTKKEQTSFGKKSMAVAAAGVLALGALGGATLAPTPEPVETIVEVEKIVNQTIDLTQEQRDVAFAEGYEQGLLDVEVPEPVEVPVDNGNLELVLEHIFDNDGQVEFLTDDLDADEIGDIVGRVVFVNDIKTLAAEYVDKEFADELDREEFEVATNETIEFDEDDVESVNVEDDFDEIIVDEIDFDDQEAELILTVDFEHDDDDFEATVRVEIQDGEVDDMEILSVVRD